MIGGNGMKKKHNGIISFWKFIFSLLIIVLHLGLKHPNVRYNFRGGSIGVEFFFIVSGYLFCYKCLKTADTNITENMILFFFNKIKRFIPYIVFLWLFSLPYVILIDKIGINGLITAFYNLIYVPVKNNPLLDIFGITWYIAAMIIAQWLLYPLIVKYKKAFIYYVSPLIVYFGGNYLLIKYGQYAVPWMPSIICFSGLIRALVGINIGMIVFLISNKIKDINFNKFSCFLMTVFEILGYISMFIFANKADAHMRFDVLMTIILSICISISFSTKSLLYNISNNKLFYTLEKLSLPLYLNQWAIIMMTEWYINHHHINIGFYYELFIIILISIIIGVIEELLISLYHKKKNNIKKLFINP